MAIDVSPAPSTGWAKPPGAKSAHHYTKGSQYSRCRGGWHSPGLALSPSEIPLPQEATVQGTAGDLEVKPSHANLCSCGHRLAFHGRDFKGRLYCDTCEDICPEPPMDDLNAFEEEQV